MNNPRYHGYFYKYWEGALDGVLFEYTHLTRQAREAAEGLKVGESRTFRSAFPPVPWSQVEPGIKPDDLPWHGTIINMGRGGEYAPPLPETPRVPDLVNV